MYVNINIYIYINIQREKTYIYTYNSKIITQLHMISHDICVPWRSTKYTCACAREQPDIFSRFNAHVTLHVHPSVSDQICLHIDDRLCLH